MPVYLIKQLLASKEASRRAGRCEPATGLVTGLGGPALPGSQQWVGLWHLSPRERCDHEAEMGPQPPFAGKETEAINSSDHILVSEQVSL